MWNLWGILLVLQAVRQFPSKNLGQTATPSLRCVGGIVASLAHEASGQDLVHDFAVDIGQAKVAAGVTIGETFVVDAEDV
ncbi:MAG: hypothetical protein ACI8W8_004965 [Rhodothermales bacterium]|jgi:hypothetical protein